MHNSHGNLEYVPVIPVLGGQKGLWGACGKARLAQSVSFSSSERTSLKERWRAIGENIHTDLGLHRQEHTGTDFPSATPTHKHTHKSPVPLLSTLRYNPDSFLKAT